MLVTLLVLWAVVVPVLTLAGAYVLSGVVSRHARAGSERPPGLAPVPVRITPSRRHRAPIREREHAGHSRDHALIQR